MQSELILYASIACFGWGRGLRSVLSYMRVKCSLPKLLPALGWGN